MKRYSSRPARSLRYSSAAMRRRFAFIFTPRLGCVVWKGFLKQRAGEVAPARIVTTDSLALCHGRRRCYGRRRLEEVRQRADNAGARSHEAPLNLLRFADAKR